MNILALCVALVLGGSPDPLADDQDAEGAADQPIPSDSTEVQDSEPLVPPGVGQIHQSLFGVEGTDVGYRLDVPDGADLDLKEGSSYLAFVVQDPELRFTFHATRVGPALKVEPVAKKAPRDDDPHAEPAPEDDADDDDASPSEVRHAWGRLIYQEQMVSFIGLVTRAESDGKRVYVLLPLVQVDHALLDGEFEILRDLIVKRDLRMPGFAERIIPNLQTAGRLTDEQVTDLMNFVKSVRELLRDGNLESAIDNSLN